MALEGISAHPDDVVVTVGSQMGLDMVTRVFCDPGDVVLAEAPSYVGALGTFSAYQAQVVHVEMDDAGLVPEALHQALAAMAASGRRVKFLYTIPNFQNPAGVTLSVQRRAEVLEICAQHDVLVVEDNPYGLLGFDGQTYPALRSVESDNVVHLGSFSKTFAPGLRVGWVLAPHAVREKLVLAAEAATLCPPAFTQAVVSRYLAQHDWKDQIKTYQEAYRERRDATLSAMEQHLLAGCSWTKPDGVPYVGTDSRACRRAWDKPVAKAELARVGLTTPDWVEVTAPQHIPRAGRSSGARRVGRQDRAATDPQARPGWLGTGHPSAGRVASHGDRLSRRDRELPSGERVARTDRDLAAADGTGSGRSLTRRGVRRAR
jgi:DNA-binding transcriptional MocR family regulator